MQQTIQRARHLRANMTDAERLLWSHLKSRKLNGHKFRRQHIIGSYIVDFVCLKAELIVECDGSQHQDLQKLYDKNRDLYLKQCGYKILRFWNNDVLTNIEGVWQIISENLLPLGCPHPNLPPRGEGIFFATWLPPS